MRTYRVFYMIGARCIYETRLKAANKRECLRKANQMPLPTLEVPEHILVKPIKNKGDR